MYVITPTQETAMRDVIAMMRCCEDNNMVMAIEGEVLALLLGYVV